MRELIAEGLEKQDAKLKIQEEIDDAVSEILGIAKSDMTITQGIKDLKQYSIPDYNSLEVFELKSLLKQRGHDTKGRKKH
jgi:parvulin-like peptidyl-prolyl isomerase